MFTCRSRVVVGILCLAGIFQLFFIATTDYRTQPDPPNDPVLHALKHEIAKAQREDILKPHEVAGLSCQKYGGPSDEIASEMVYWSDIPSDSKFVSPFKSHGPKKKYLTFELDEGGWNNIRMSMETAVALAFAMGRTLVMPPSQWIYLLDNGQKQQKNRFGFGDFFHFDSVNLEHAGLEIISTQEFLEREVMTGNIRGKSGEIVFPPQNRTNYDGEGWIGGPTRKLELWIRNTIAEPPMWNGDKCLAVIPEKPGPVTDSHLMDMLHQIQNSSKPVGERIQSFFNNPTPVDAPIIDRMREQLSERTDLCIYDEKLQHAPVLHFMGDNNSGARLLVHFYVYLFFENYKQDLWTKRFIRDHLRYVDEIQCAAARVVNAVREKARENGIENGEFSTFHIRRGDFQYDWVKLNATDLLANVNDTLKEGATIYIATDERDKSFFDPFRQHYTLYFLDDFMHLLEGVNTNFFGMLDQLIASRGKIFVGTYYSTFTGYINRIRGYHSQKDKEMGYREGRIRSYYFAPKYKKNCMIHYNSIRPEYWGREWPVSWRDIDQGIKEMAKTPAQ